MGKLRTFQALVVVALAAASLVGTASISVADSDTSRGTIRLDERFEGWFSNGMNNDPGACGPFETSADAVVWHLYVQLPDDLDVTAEDLTKVQVDFAGRVAHELDYAVAGSRIDIWARVTLKNPGNANYLRQGAHTSIRKAQVHIAGHAFELGLERGGDDDDGYDSPGGIGRGTTIQLGNVCYSGLGPIGEITFYLQGMVCDGYDRFAGNQVTDASSQWDQTAGDWRLWEKVYEKNAPTVKVAGKTKGCSFSGAQQFAVGTTSGMANRYVIPVTTDAADNGLIKISSSDLPEEHQRALFWANEELWFERMDNQNLGAFQCYDDRLHADNFEWILIRDYDKLPSTITCVAWNVAG